MKSKVKTLNSPRERSFTIKEEDLEFVSRIATGGFGEIFLGYYLPDSRKVAIKKLYSEEIDLSISNEIKIHKQLDDKYILNLVGYTTTKPYLIVTEFMENKSLYDWIHNSQMKLSSTDFTIISYGIAKGMEYIHSRSIIHRDLKPSNILLDHLFLPRICDFGISTKFDSIVRDRMGTIAYAPPEVLSDSSYNNKVDVYSFGVILFEMLTGNNPFFGKNANQILLMSSNNLNLNFPDDTPSKLKELILNCLNHDSNMRPSFSDIANDLLNGNVFFPGTDRELFETFFENFIMKIPEVAVPTPIIIKNKDKVIEEEDELSDVVVGMSIDNILVALQNIENQAFENAVIELEKNVLIAKPKAHEFWETLFLLVITTPVEWARRISGILTEASQYTSLLSHLDGNCVYVVDYTLEVINNLVYFSPDIVDSSMCKDLQVVTLKSEEKYKEQAVLILIKKIEQEKAGSPMIEEILEILKLCAPKLVEYSCGAYVIKTLYIYRDVIKFKIDKLLDLAKKFFESSIDQNVIAVYEILLSLDKPAALFDIGLVNSHIIKENLDLRDLAIEYLRLNIGKLDNETIHMSIQVLLNSYELYKYNRAMLLLCKIAEDSSYSSYFFGSSINMKMLTLRSDYCTGIFPLFVLLWKSDPKFPLSHPKTPYYLSCLIRYSDSDMFILLCDIISQTKLEREIYESLNENSAIEILCSRILSSKSRRDIEYGSKVLYKYAAIEFLSIYMLVIPVISLQILGGIRDSYYCLYSLLTMTNHPQCIQKIKEYLFMDYFNSFFGLCDEETKEFVQLANQLKERLENSSK